MTLVIDFFRANINFKKCMSFKDLKITISDLKQNKNRHVWNW